MKPSLMAMMIYQNLGFLTKLHKKIVYITKKVCFIMDYYK